jgi:hypothetical protein
MPGVYAPEQLPITERHTVDRAQRNGVAALRGLGSQQVRYGVFFDHTPPGKRPEAAAAF